MTTLELTKLHGLGNDFLIALDPPPSLESRGAELARLLCERHRGIGADGFIVARSPGARSPGASSAGDRGPAGGSGALTFSLWNADGSEAEVSGNGLRCLAHAALDAGVIAEGEEVGIDTPAGMRGVTVVRKSATTTWASVDMGIVKVEGEADRCNIGHGQLLVDVGNPHLVVLGPDPASVDVATLGPLLEATDASGLNVEFVALGPAADEITMRVWERGVGETEACGTGSCAAAAALHHWGRTGAAVTVHQPGGSVAVELRSDGTAVLSGPSERVAACRVEL